MAGLRRGVSAGLACGAVPGLLRDSEDVSLPPRKTWLPALGRVCEKLLEGFDRSLAGYPWPSGQRELS